MYGELFILAVVLYYAKQLNTVLSPALRSRWVFFIQKFINSVANRAIAPVMKTNGQAITRCYCAEERIGMVFNKLIKIRRDLAKSTTRVPSDLRMA